MTERKPPGMTFETWVDRVIRDGQERGEFEDLAGKGKPIADLHEPTDDLWWVRGLLRREEIEYLPPSLALKKESEAALQAALAAPTEAEARRLLEDVNVKIRNATRMAIGGPPVLLFPHDVDEVLERRQVREAARRAARPDPPPEVGAGRDDADGRRLRRWWGRRRRARRDQT
jgi:DnaJ homologue, subfamily C, member 28, conserved domain